MPDEIHHLRSVFAVYSVGFGFRVCFPCAAFPRAMSESVAGFCQRGNNRVKGRDPLKAYQPWGLVWLREAMTRGRCFANSNVIQSFSRLVIEYGVHHTIEKVHMNIQVRSHGPVLDVQMYHHYCKISWIHVCVGFLQVLRFPPTLLEHAIN